MRMDDDPFADYLPLESGYSMFMASSDLPKDMYVYVSIYGVFLIWGYP